MKKILRNYQLGAIRYLRRGNGGALFVEMRLGKTLCTVRYLQMKNAKRVIIVAPYSAFNSWLEEAPFIQRIDIHAEPCNWQVQPGWFIINKEAHLRNDFLKYQWDAIVIDESFIQNPQAKVTKYMLSNANRISIRILLSGTPAPESELQYYTQLAFLFPGVFGVRNYWEYRVRYARLDMYRWELTMNGRNALIRVLRDKCFILKCKDVNLYPEPVFEKRVIQLTNENRKIYTHAEHDCLDEFDRVLKFAGEKWNYLRRLCSQKEKEKELLSLLNGELKDKKVIIWCYYIEECKRLSELLKAPYICGEVPLQERLLRINSYCKYLIIQPETMKFGANLSSADTEIYFSTPQGLLTRQQSERRLIDVKRKYPILVIDLVAENTIEEDILESLKRKETNQKMLERIRNGIHRRNY